MEQGDFMPTLAGLPRVGEYVVDGIGRRWKVLERTTNDRHCSVRVEDESDSRGYRYITEVMYWLGCEGWRIEEQIGGSGDNGKTARST